MQLTELTRYHIPPSLIAGWLKRQGDMLLPLQNEALRQGLLSDEPDSDGESLLISGPTSTGKTFCAELALAGAIVRRRKGVLLVPLKSIAEEKFADFEPLYRRLKLKCIIATADHPEYNRALACGEFDIAVCVYEKFNRALLANIDLLGRLGSLIIDEAQLLTDPERGVVLESILLKLAGYRQASVSANGPTVSAPRLIALTASLLSDSALAERLGARLIRDTRRPVELRQGVLFDGTYRYFNRDTGEIGSEERNSQRGAGVSATAEAERESGERAAPIAAELLERLCADRCPKLVFLSGRRRVIEAGLALASCGRWPRAAQALDELIGEEPSAVVRSLSQALTCGVAFHSADLTAFQRRVIERGFRSAEITVIFCTTTLGLGVNLPAETVYIEPFKYNPSVIANRGSGQKNRSGALLPLPRADFENIAGRAGRYRCRIIAEPTLLAEPTPLARAVLLARTEFERDVLWENYIEPSQRSATELLLTVDACQASDTFASLALEIICCGLAPTVSRLAEVFAALVASSQNASCHSVSRKDASRGAALFEAVERLRELGLLDSDCQRADGVSLTTLTTLTATALGRVAAASGLSLICVAHFVSALKRIQPTAVREWLALALSAPDFLASGAGGAPRAGGVPRAGGAVEGQLFATMPDAAERLLMCLSGGRPVPNGMKASASSQARTPELASRVHAFLTLEAWRVGERANFLETRCQMSVAQVARLAQNARWLLQGLSDIAFVSGALSAESDVALRLTALMNSLRYGLPESAIALRESLQQSAENRPCVLAELFNRAELMELDRSDCRTAADVAALLAASGAKILSDTSINPAAALKVKQRRLRERLTALSRASAISATTETQNDDIHSNKKERSMREQVVREQVIGGHLSPQALPVKATTGAVPPLAALALVPCSLQVDGSARGERFLLRVDGLPVALTGKSFKYLVKLVCARLSQPEGWIYKDDIEIGFNQARYLYRMRREIAAQLPGYRWSVYENNRLGYYRLALDSAALDVNRERLSHSPDYEVAQIASALPETLSPGGAAVSTEGSQLG